MKKFEYLEHYIEFMGGLRDARGQSIIRYNSKSPLRLANYDVQVLADLSNQVALSGIGLTDKQRDLALHLANKYAKQLRKLGVEPPDDTTLLEHPLRIVKRDKGLTIEDGCLALRFPFNAKLISQIRDYAGKSFGRCAWHNNLGYWKIATTEPNVLWVVEYCQNNEIPVDSEIIDYYNELVIAKKQEFNIELEVQGNSFGFINAPRSLLEYIETTVLSGEEKQSSKIYQLLDNASLFSYKLGRSVKEPLIKAGWSDAFLHCLDNHSTTVSGEMFESTVYDDLIRWMTVTGKSPIIIYDPLKEFDKYKITPNDQIIQVAISKDTTMLSIADPTEIVQQSNPWTLISFFNMISFNPRHQEMLQTAERLIYVGVLYKNDDQ